MEPRPKLIVMAAFDKVDDGEERAHREACSTKDQLAGVIACSRNADPALGEFGPPNVLFQSGKIPGME
jgi:hypothetical protein